MDAHLANLTLSRVWKILDQAIERSKANRDLVLGVAQMWGAYVGDGVDRQSMKYFFLEDCIGGGKEVDNLLAHL